MMKAVYILIAIAVIAAVGFMLAGGPDEVNENEPANIPVNENTDATPIETPEVEPGDSPAPEDDMEIGSDVGMEFPALDSDVDEMVVENDTDSSPSPEAAVGQVKEFTVDAFSFGYSLEEIKVKEGDTVTINLTNSAGFHDWVVDEFDAATSKINTGEKTSVTFVVNKKGSFEYYCSVGNHRAQGMVGTLIVE